MTYKTEFPDFPDFDVPALPEGYRDSSWGADMCPCWTHDDLRLVIHADYSDPASRVCPDNDRFAVFQLDDDGCYDGGDAILITSDFAEVIALHQRHLDASKVRA